MTDKSESSIRLALGDDCHLRLRQEQSLGKRLNNKISLQIQADRVFLPEYANFSQIQLYKEQMKKFRVRLDRLIGRERLTGFVTDYTEASWCPRLRTAQKPRTVNTLFSVFYNYQRQSTNTLNFPQKGVYTDIQA
jgi:hypothetical protein